MRGACLLLLLAVSCGRELPPAPPRPADEGFERMGPPQPGDWLARFPEEEQTLEDYKADCANRRTRDRARIVLQPLGAGAPADAELLEAMRAYCEAYFMIPCAVAAPVPLPATCFRKDRGQYNGDQLLGALEEHLPDDALALAGITSEDLYSGDLNFVFGLGSLKGRRGVYSLHRLGEGRKRLERALKLVTHELGHVLSITHCVKYRCVMSGANSQAEADRYPFHACPDDLAKLQWNLGFEVAARYRALEACFRRLGFPAEAEWVAARLASR